MKAISFCLNGKMAHFRKYYSNSTALSHFIPPVTTVKGIIAGLLGYERDTYYALFSKNNCRISICVNNPIKKIVQKMNLLKIEKVSNLNASHKDIRTQTNTEWVFPYNIRDSYVSYKIIFTHKDKTLMERFSEKVCTNSIHYLSDGISMALGSAQCLGWIDGGKWVECNEFISNNHSVFVKSVIVKENIESIELNSISKISLAKDENIVEFSNDFDRSITKNSKKEILFTLDGQSLNCQLKPGCKVYDVEGDKVLFIE